MTDKEKSQIIAEAENVEAIRDFFIEWWSVEQLYETSSKACSTILHLIDKCDICSEEKSDFKELIEQHLMLIDLVKPFARKDGEV